MRSGYMAAASRCRAAPEAAPRFGSSYRLRNRRRTMAEGRILVVDDEESIADSFRAVLQDEGYTVRTAGSAARALAEVERADWDVAFVDLVLPDMDGLELLKKLKARRPGLLAVIITAHGSGAKGFAAREAGAWAFLEKPDDMVPEKILNVVANALEHKKLRETIYGRNGYGKNVGRPHAR